LSKQNDKLVKPKKAPKSDSKTKVKTLKEAKKAVKTEEKVVKVK
jgi:hypothetical protein